MEAKCVENITLCPSYAKVVCLPSSFNDNTLSQALQNQRGGDRRGEENRKEKKKGEEMGGEECFFLRALQKKDALPVYNISPR